MARTITTSQLLAIPEIEEPKPIIPTVVSTAAKQLKSLASEAGEVMYPRRPIEEGFMRPRGPVVQAVQKFGRGYTGGIMEPVRKRLGIPPMPPAEAPGVKRLGTVAELGGALAGIPQKAALAVPKYAAKAVPALAGKGLLPIAARLGLGTGTFAGLEDLGRPPAEIAKRAAIGAGIGAALPFGAKGAELITRPVRQFGTAIAGIFPETVKQVKRIGFSKVTEPAKRQAQYFTENLVPRVQRNFSNLMRKGTKKTEEFLSTHEVTPKSIKTLISSGWNKTKQVYDKYDGNLGLIVDKIKRGADISKKQASQKFDLAFNKSKIDKIGIKNTYYKLRKDLTDLGLVDKAGNPMAEKYGNPALDGLLRVYNNMRTHLVSKKVGKDVVTGFINKSKYNQYKMAIESLESNVPATNRYIYKTVRSLRSDAKESIPALKEAMKDYARAMELQDELYSTTGTFKLNENFLRRKWDLNTSRKMINLNEKMPKEYEFLNDLNKFKAADEINKKVSDVYSDPVKIEQILGQFSEYKSPKGAKIERTRNILKYFDDREIADDALSHYLAKDLYQETLPPGFMGAAGLTRKATELAVRGGLKTREIYRKRLHPTVKEILQIKE